MIKLFSPTLRTRSMSWSRNEFFAPYYGNTENTEYRKETATTRQEIY